jgi:hypothetical protein
VKNAKVIFGHNVIFLANKPKEHPFSLFAKSTQKGHPFSFLQKKHPANPCLKIQLKHSLSFFSTKPQKLVKIQQKTIYALSHASLFSSDKKLFKFLELDVFCALFNDDRFLTEWRVILY